MITRLFGIVALIASAAFFATAAQAAGNPAAGKVKSQTCLGCHGVAGYTNFYPDYEVPRVAGQHATYIIAALKDYKSGKRDFATMHAQASELSTQDMKDIAAYFSSIGKDYTPAKGPVGIAKAKTCAACHGKHGISTAGMFPILAGQHYSYLVHALKQYKSGARKNAIMNGMAAGLSLQDIKKVASYFASQPSPLDTLPRPSF